MPSNVPTPAFTSQGFVGPLELDVLAGVQLDINAAFNNKLNFTTMGGSVTNPTPQGQIAASQAACVSNAYAAYRYMTQMFDPAYSKGRYQDALARIYFIYRNPALPTVVSAKCGGGGNTIIPVGARARATDGNIYVSTQQGTIDPVTGIVVLEFACLVEGPIPCPAGTLNAVYQMIPGWESITNDVDGAIGKLSESRSELEERRSQSVAINSMGQLASIRGKVLAVPGVLDAFVVDNPLNTASTVGGYLMQPNSLYVAAVGGTDLDVAQAIYASKLTTATRM